jgi:hypothetical protein
MGTPGAIGDRAVFGPPDEEGAGGVMGGPDAAPQRPNVFGTPDSPALDSVFGPPDEAGRRNVMGGPDTPGDRGSAG